MGRRALATIVGTAAAVLIVLLVEYLGVLFYPQPPGLDTSDPAALSDAIAQLPTGALLFVLGAWLLGAGGGAGVAQAVCRRSARWPGFAVGSVILAGAGWSLVAIPHPIWFTAAALVGIPLVTYSSSVPPRVRPAGS